MPSPPHDALVQMFRDRPQFAVEILYDLMEVDLPATPLVRVEPNTFNPRLSDDFEVDLVIVMGPPQTPAHAIIVEIQQDKSKDPRQLARYAAALWLMLGCDVSVLVVCPDRGVAAHYAQPIDSGLTGYRPHARVLGPDGIPPITDPHEAAAHLELSAMSVMVHGRDHKVIEAFTTAVADTLDKHALKYYEYAYGMSSPEICRLMEEIMKSTTWPVYSPFAREYYGRGFARGYADGLAQAGAEPMDEQEERERREQLAKSVLTVLAARDFDIPDDTHARITACTDLTQLRYWLILAATTQTLESLFNEPNY